MFESKKREEVRENGRKLHNEELQNAYFLPLFLQRLNKVW
jgi:hypothetical protein